MRGRHRWLPLLQLVLLPALVLVDHGHFQYNCVSLGLALWAFTAALRGRPLACAFCFTLALNFKQMSLYLAPAIFCYLLAGCLRAATKTAAALRVARLGTVVLATTALCWAPFLGSWADARAVLVRVFPVGRHLYEDKVASVWCTLALTPLKLKHLLSIPTLVRLTLGVTLAALGPPCGCCSRGRRAPASSWARRRAHSPSSSSRSRCTRSTCCFRCSPPPCWRRAAPPPSAGSPPSPPSRCTRCSSATATRGRSGCRTPSRSSYSPRSRSTPPPSASPRAGGRPAAVAAPLAARACSPDGALHAADLLVAPPARYPDLHAALAAYACVHLGCAYLAALYAQWRLAATEPPHTPFDDARADVPLLSGAKEE